MEDMAGGHWVGLCRVCFEWKHEDGLSTRAVHMHQLRDHHKSQSSQRVPVHVRS